MTAPKRTRDRVLADASTAINGDRQQDYGDARPSFERIAAMWALILDTPVSSHQVAQCLAAMKISRSMTSPEKLDNWVDMAGYAALGAELAGADGPAQATLDLGQLGDPTNMKGA